MLIAAAVAIVGFAAFWSNPRRAVNGGFFALSLLVALWLICLTFVLQSGTTGQIWYRMTAIVGVFVIVPLWFIKEAIIGERGSAREILIRSRWWVVGCSLLGAIRVSEVSYANLNLSFHLYFIGLAVMYALLLRMTVVEMRVQTGVKRLELQIVLLGGGATALTVVGLLVFRNILGVLWLIRLVPVVVLLFYTGTVVAITTSRVFNARQILAVGVQNFILVTVVAAAAYGIDHILAGVLVDPVAWMFTIGFALWLSVLLKTWLDRVFDFYPQGKMVRQAAFAVAQRERTVEKLEEAFRSLLAGWGHAESALIMSGNKQALSSGTLQLDGDGPVMRTIRELRWVTPERLARERSTADREALAKFLSEQQLGVLVIEDGLTLTTLVGVGLSAARRPFTYPQVTQLAELASIVESALERAHFSAKVQHTEQLATVGVLGASLAHEIRNPLVSIKTFVQLLPTHYNDPAFRNKFFRLIGDEVSRIDQLTDQLLDLSTPRVYMAQMVDLHPFLLSGLDLVAAKASHRQVQLQTDFQASPDRAFTDASAAKQVMLNLCFNAIQAVEACEESARWVKISTRNVGNRIEMSVSDGGPGISPEIRPKLFQPFQTTKSTGFGLGLAVCSDILANLQASISVDPPESGRGATFRVTFPCQPLSS
jgi:signal transduction histidine kinase